MLRAGMKVVCIDVDGAPQLQLNGVYTISRILPMAECLRNRIYLGKICPVELYEVDPFPGNYGFDPNRFRPAVSRKTDISIFQKMLTRKKINA